MLRGGLFFLANNIQHPTPEVTVIAPGRSRVLRSELQLRSSDGSPLRCPSAVPPVEAQESFGGVGPGLKLSLKWCGLEMKVLKSEVDINKGIISFYLELDEWTDQGGSLSIVDRCRGLHVKGSPCAVTLPKTSLQPVEHISPRQALPGLTPRAENLAILLDEPQTFEDRRLLDSPKKPPPVLSALQFSRAQRMGDEPQKALKEGLQPEMEQLECHPDRRSTAFGRVYLRPVSQGKIASAKRREVQQSPSLLADVEAPELREETKTRGGSSQEARSTFSSSYFEEKSSPRRYMPSEPLPSHRGWGKKSKSKSPKKNRQHLFAKSYW